MQLQRYRPGGDCHRMPARVDGPNEVPEVGLALNVAFGSVTGMAAPIFKPV